MKQEFAAGTPQVNSERETASPAMAAAAHCYCAPVVIPVCHAVSAALQVGTCEPDLAKDYTYASIALGRSEEGWDG